MKLRNKLALVIFILWLLVVFLFIFNPFIILLLNIDIGLLADNSALVIKLIGYFMMATGVLIAIFRNEASAMQIRYIKWLSKKNHFQKTTSGLPLEDMETSLSFKIVRIIMIIAAIVIFILGCRIINII